MPEQAPNTITRAQWQKWRDAAGVKKGAAKVSIGDSIDKVHKAWNKAPMNIAETAKAMDQLIKDLKAYQTAIKGKFPKANDLIAKINIMIKDMTDQIAHWQKMANPSKACADAIKNAVSAVGRVKSKPEVDVLGKEYGGPIRFVGMALTDLSKKPGYEPVEGVRAYWYKCDAIKAFSGGPDKIAAKTDHDADKKILHVVALLEKDLKHVTDEMKKLHIMA